MVKHAYPNGMSIDEMIWADVVGSVRTGTPVPPIPEGSRLASLAALGGAEGADGMLLIGQAGQSLCGHIATESGHSHYINGPDALDHLHRLRAVVDGVMVGWRTVHEDSPRLTVRRVAGDDPARIVVDARGCLPSETPLFQDADGSVVYRVTTPGIDPIDGVFDLPVAPDPQGRLPPAGIRAALREAGFKRVLLEGGAMLLSSFLAAGALDRLHVLVAPLIIGSGRPGLQLPVVERLDSALRPPTRITRLGDDVLFDLDLRQALGGSTNRSM